MLYRKEGYPEEDEFVLCTVTKIQYHSVFCHLDEYDKSGMIHISEIAPGRIRNIRDYVQEGKKVVCKVLKIDEEKGHIDLSLRRVTEAQKKVKLSMIKQEQKAEKIIESLSEKVSIPVNKLYSDVASALFEHYEMIYLAFEDVVEEDFDLKETGLDKKIADPLMELVKEKIKPKEVTIGGYLKIKTYDPEGVEIIKKGLKDAGKAGKAVIISYSGSGRYRIMVTAPDYKQAERELDEAVKTMSKFMESNEGTCAFERI